MIYLDSCILIYAVEDDDARGERVRQRLADAGDSTVAINADATKPMTARMIQRTRASIPAPAITGR